MHNALPSHIAVVMDGNSRWAKQRGKASLAGHREGGKALERVTDACLDAGVSYLTLFAFSSENWRRPKSEVAGLMELFAQTLKRDTPNLVERGICLKVAGRRDRLSASLVKLIEASEAATQANSKMFVTLCVDYGGQWDIAQAARQASLAGVVDEEAITQHLALAHAPPVDLLIRTGGEQRISNFTLWQAAYAELVFVDTLWPDMTADHLNQCLADFAGRERRFGGRNGERVQA